MYIMHSANSKIETIKVKGRGLRSSFSSQSWQVYLANLNFNCTFVLVLVLGFRVRFPSSMAMAQGSSSRIRDPYTWVSTPMPRALSPGDRGSAGLGWDLDLGTRARGSAGFGARQGGAQGSACLDYKHFNPKPWTSDPWCRSLGSRVYDDYYHVSLTYNYNY